jgi:GNAT superfamily N-acetyltransferase
VSAGLTPDSRQQPAPPRARLDQVDAEPASPARDLQVRQARAEDRAALEAMFQRCSPATIYRRFHGHVRAFPQPYLSEALASASGHHGIVAYAGREAVALASCRNGALGTAELGILIEDAWQRRGLGRMLVARLMAHADAAGIGVLHAQMLIEQDWITGMLAPYGSCTSAFGSGVREVTLHRDRSRPEGAVAAGPPAVAP